MNPFPSQIFQYFPTFCCCCFQSTTKLIKEAMEFPRKRFIELVKKYVHFRRVKEIQENVKKMKMQSNINERVILAMQATEERMIKVG